MEAATGRHVLGFRRDLGVEWREGDGLLVFSESGTVRLSAPGLRRLASLLDGTRTPDEICRGTGDGADEETAGLLESLGRAGLVSLREDRPEDPAAAAYWDAAGVGTGAGTTGPVTVTGLGRVPLGPVRDALRATGLRVTEPGDGDDRDAGEPALGVVLCDDYLDPGLAAVDLVHRASGRPWLLVRPVGTRLWIGPVFEPGQPGCWECLARRLWRHRRAETSGTRSRPEPGRRPLVGTGGTIGAAAHLVAQEAAKWLAGYRRPGGRSVWTIDTLSLDSEHHALPVYRECPVCGDGDPAAGGPHPVRLRSRPVTPDPDGNGHRALGADQVWQRLSHLISPVTGIVKRIEPHRAGPPDLHAYRAGPNLGTGAATVDDLVRSLRSENGGKGTTAAQARTSALCEAVERYAGEFRPGSPRVRSSLRALGADGVDPTTCLLVDDRQYRGRAEWNAAVPPVHAIGPRFDPDAELDWTPLWSLTHGRHRYLPTSMLYFGAPPDPARSVSYADSNGCAAGTCPEDAVLQGLLELVERDAVGIWWYNRLPSPVIELDADATDVWPARVRDLHRGLGREVWALDLTTDTGIPAVVALSRRTGGGPEEIMLGFGAHLDPRVALRRALSELNQMMPAVLGAGPDRERPACPDPAAERWLRTATVATEPWLYPSDTGRVPVGAMPDLSSADLLDEIGTVRRNLERLGMEVLVLDQTVSDVDVPVFRTVVPGLRGLRARFAPGRLYDVPVRLGRVEHPTAYADLNPTPMFL